MVGKLTTEQVLLLNNLMYMNEKIAVRMDDCKGMTLGDVFANIDTNSLESGKKYTDFTTGQEWKDIIEAIRSDPQLNNVRITDTYDDGNGGKAVLFENPSDSEAVVVFKGTGSPTEWKDNFMGGAGTGHPDGVTTTQQQNALDWYRSLNKENYETITVSGHSKGGNKAKYVTLMDESVDRCISFDGQGFSDEFVDKYAEQIAKQQYKIENHNIDKDPVNILLNDIGHTIYYKGYNYGSKNLFEHHTPNAFMHFDSNGNFCMVLGKQSSDLKNIDEFFNNYLRSLSDTEKKGTMEFLGSLFEIGMGNRSTKNGTELINEILDVLTDGDNVDYSAKLLAYFLRYEQENPEVAETIRNLMKEMDFGDFINTTDMILEIVNSEEFNQYLTKLLGGVDWIVDRTPNWILKKISDWIKKKYGIDLSPVQLRKLSGVLEALKKEIPKVKIKDNGADKKVGNAQGIGRFSVNTAGLGSAMQQFSICENELMEISSEITNVLNLLDISLSRVKPSLEIQKENVERRRADCRKLKTVLEEIARSYDNAEQKAVELLHFW